MVYLGSMNHFVETEQLLSQGSFLRYIGQLYEAFIDLEDFAKVDAKNLGETFTVNLQRWQQLTKEKEPRRFFSGGSGFFLAYVKHEIEQLIYKDWRGFNAKLPDKQKEQLPKIREFLIDVKEIESVIENRPYLELLSATIKGVLANIVVEYDELKLENMNAHKVVFDDMDIHPLQWNGGTAMLIELFRDLLDARTSDGKRYITNPSTLQLVHFIHANFVNEKGVHIDKETLKKYIYDRKKSVVKKIELRFPEESKTTGRTQQNDYD